MSDAAGILPYLRQAQRGNYFNGILMQMYSVSSDWRKNVEHGPVLRDLQEVGGLNYVPSPTLEEMVKWLTLVYLGEPGGYGTMGRGRSVFYSNTGAPLSAELLSDAKEVARVPLVELATDDEIKALCSDEHLARRYQSLLDLVGA